METKAQPLVCVLTPVYNGEAYLSECIESVINQSYRNWEYIIVNNCSTDSSLDIATRYASMDSRIRIVNNTRFVDIIENHNIAFGLISQDSKYCKMVHADDWLFPNCISRLVEVAEEYPSTGIVGAYALTSEQALFIGLPPRSNLFPGREALRIRLLGERILGPPTAILYRAEIIRNEKPFFAVPAESADSDTNYRVLLNHDLGFVHQILSFVRTHDKQSSSKLIELGSFTLSSIEYLLKYGPECLSSEELDKYLDELLIDFYDSLAYSVFHNWEVNFWRYQKDRMREIGINISYSRLIMVTMQKLADILFNPKSTIEKIARRFKSD